MFQAALFTSVTGGVSLKVLSAVFKKDSGGTRSRGTPESNWLRVLIDGVNAGSLGGRDDLVGL